MLFRSVSQSRYRHKEQVRDANLLIGYLDTIQGIEKKRAEIEKEITKTVKDEYEARIKGIKEVEEYQQKLADQAKRSHLALLGDYATDTDKAIAEQAATQQKLAASNGVNPSDLRGNIEGGVKYISEMLQTFNGDLSLAIAAYNAGPQAVKDYNGIPPYHETQEYVNKVMSEYNNPSSPTTGTQQVYVSGLNDVLSGAGVSQESWKGMSAESKKQFIEDHKDQVKDANLLIGYLNTISGIEKKRAEIGKDITKTVKIIQR